MPISFEGIIYVLGYSAEMNLSQNNQTDLDHEN